MLSAKHKVSSAGEHQKGKASTIVQVEGLPSLDASLGVDVVAVPGSGRTLGAARVGPAPISRGLLN